MSFFIKLKSAERSADFFILCGFLAAFWPSVVHLYADENQSAASASNCDNPVSFIFTTHGCLLFKPHADLTAAERTARAVRALNHEAAEIVNV